MKSSSGEMSDQLPTGEEELPRDYYASYLSEVNKENGVLSTEDIYNKQGVLLVRRGTSINSKAADRIIRHKLTKPLEDQIQLENSINRETLENQFLNLFESYQDLAEVHNKLKFKLLFKNILHTWEFHPNIAQKLTVLHQEMPGEFSKSLFTAWLSALLARELAFDNSMITTSFVAGLVHDIGYIHIDPAIIKKQEKLTPPEWRTIQSHPVVGKIVMGNIPDIDPLIEDAVLEHHERGDGIGYPRGIVEEDLKVLGQIVGMADSIQAIRVNQFQKIGRNLRDTLPFLQMNQYTHSYAVYKAMISIIQKSALPPTVSNPKSTVAGYSTSLMAKWQSLREVVFCLEKLISLLENMKPDKSTNSLIKLTHHLSAMINQSGLNGEEIGIWLQGLREKPTEEEILPELNELELIMNELKWQLKNTCRAYEKFFEKVEAGRDPNLQAIEQVACKLRWALERADNRTGKSIPVACKTADPLGQKINNNSGG